MVETMTERPELLDLIDQSLALIAQIQNHTDFKSVKYSPDLTLGDAQQALIELRWQSLPQSPIINIFALEGFTN